MRAAHVELLLQVSEVPETKSVPESKTKILLLCQPPIWVDDPMIRGIHGLFYTSRPEEARAFVRDKLRLPHTDVGHGWLIFDVPEADLGFHPTSGSENPPSGTHEVSFYCDDIKGTVASLKKNGVIFDQDVSEEDFGFITYFTLPGGVKVMLYEPKYTKHRSITKNKLGRNRTRTLRRR